MYVCTDCCSNNDRVQLYTTRIENEINGLMETSMLWNLTKFGHFLFEWPIVEKRELEHVLCTFFRLICGTTGYWNVKISSHFKL